MAALLGGRTALITGAGSGIGKAVCELLARHGASIVAVDIANADQVCGDLHVADGAQHQHYAVDVKKEDQVMDCIQTAYQTAASPLSIAVNCAGITRDSYLMKMKEEAFDEVINVNLKGTFFAIKHLSQLLVKNKVQNGSIVNIASIVGKTGNVGQANYTASKAGVVALTKTTAYELAQFGIRCNAVLPGYITTPMTGKVPPPIQEQVKKMIPMGRFGTPEDVANACLFLASEQSGYITGTTLEVAGGFMV